MEGAVSETTREMTRKPGVESDPGANPRSQSWLALRTWAGKAHMKDHGSLAG